MARTPSKISRSEAVRSRGITFDAFARKLTNGARTMEEAQAQIVGGGATALASEVARAYRFATGGDGKLSGTGKARRSSGKQATVGARAKPDVRRYANNTYVGLVVPTGAYGLIERPIEKHQIVPFVYSARRTRQMLKAARRAAYKDDRSAVQATRIARASIQARTARALLIPGVGYRARAMHPGTRGRDVFSAAVARSGGKVVDGMGKAATKQILDGYRRQA